MRRRTLLSAAGLGALGLTAAACGSSTTSSGGNPTSGSGGTTPSAAASGGPKLTGTGPFNYVQGKDNNGFIGKLLAQWNAKNPSEKATLIELSPAADQQRQSMVQNFTSKTATYGVVSVDVVWTAEFAANGWIAQLDPADFPLDSYLPATVTTGQYFGKLYAAPSTSDGGLLYYRTDLLKQIGMSEPPATWDEMISAITKIKAKNPGIGGYVGQFQKYEGLTVNFQEAVVSAGGMIVDDQGKPVVDSPQAKDGLDFLVNGFKQGYIPKAAITYMEEDCRNAFQSGQAAFMRNWPYAYSLVGAKDGSSKVVGKFDIAPLPGKSGPGTSSLGGHNFAVSNFTQNKASCLKFIQFMTTQAQQVQTIKAASSAPVISSLYDDPALIKQFPYLPTLKKSLSTARRRPQAVRYNDVTTAIQTAAYGALQGNTSSADALSSLQKALMPLLKPSS